MKKLPFILLLVLTSCNRSEWRAAAGLIRYAMGFLILMLIAAAGFLASAICHVLSWLTIEPPGGHAVLCLHVGIFVVWIPLVLFANRTMPKYPVTVTSNKAR